MLAAKTLAEQRRIFERELAPLFKKRHVRWLLDRPSALFGLGIPPSQFAALKGSEASMADVLEARLERLACDFDLADNYFAWQAFGRRYASGGSAPLPPYLQRESFAALRSRAGDVAVVHASLTEHLSRQPAASLDAYVLLDAQDWMTDAQLNALWAEIVRTAQARRPRHLPHRGRGDDPSRTRAGRAARALRLRSRGLPAVDGEGPLVDLRRLPPLRVPGLRRSALWLIRASDWRTAASAAEHMDAIYRYQRYIYDATRKYYLLGRDRLLAELQPPAGGSVLEIACGTGRNLILAARRYPDARFYGFDISNAMLDTARAAIARNGLSDRISVAAGDAAEFSGERLFGVAAFDRVVISYALSMIPPWRTALQRAVDAVAPGGRLLHRRLRRAGEAAALVQERLARLARQVLGRAARRASSRACSACRAFGDAAPLRASLRRLRHLRRAGEAARARSVARQPFEAEEARHDDAARPKKSGRDVGDLKRDLPHGSTCRRSPE